MKLNKRILVLALIFMMSFQVQIYAASNTTQTQQKQTTKIDAMMDIILQNYAGSDVNKQMLIDGAIKGMFDTLDVYSEYYTAEEYDSFYKGVSGEYAGIGISVQESENYIKVLEVFDHSPAKEVDLRAGDIIVGVNNYGLKDFTFTDGLNLIKGTPGTTVDITINRNNKLIKKTVTRKIIKMSAVKDMPMNEKLASANADNIRYINISQFNANVAKDVKDALQRAEQQKAKGLLIDVRNNPGGYLDQVIEICKMLVPAGPIVHVVPKEGEVQTYYSSLEKSPFKIVILANESSASASEIMVGAIKDSSAGLMVGEKTFGKGVVQKTFMLGSNNAFKMTTAEYLTRNKTHINKVGIEPDIKVEVPNLITKNNVAWQLDLKGENVVQIEDILLYLGYSIDKVDEFYNESTVKAIKKFQADNDLTINGIADLNVQVKLNARLLESISKKDPQLQKGLEKLKELVK